MKSQFDANKLTYKHISRQGDFCDKGGHARADRKNMVSVETHVMFGNTWLFRVLGHCYYYSHSEDGSRVHIQYIETNAKLIKKLKIPFKKSKVNGWDKHESRQYSKEFNRYSVQAKMGHSFVMMVANEIAEYWKVNHDISVKEFFGDRITGIVTSINKRHTNRLVLKN